LHDARDGVLVDQRLRASDEEDDGIAAGLAVVVHRWPDTTIAAAGRRVALLRLR